MRQITSALFQKLYFPFFCTLLVRFTIKRNLHAVSLVRSNQGKITYYFDRNHGL